MEEEDSLATEEDELSPSLIPSSQEPSDYDQMRQRNIDEIEAKKATVFAGETFGGGSQKGKPVDVAATPATVEEEDSLATEEDELSPSLIPSSQEPSDYDQMRQRNIDEIEAKKATVFAGETFGGLSQKGKKAKKNKAK